MKLILKKNSFLFLFTFLLIVSNQLLNAQSFSGTYNFSAGDPNVASFAYNGSTVTNLSTSALTKVGVTTSSSAGNTRATNWPLGSTNAVNPAAGSVDTGKYFEFTITAGSGFTISNPSINFGVGRSGTGPRLFQWRSSVNGYSTQIPVTANNAGVTVNSGTIIETPDANSGYTGNTVSLSTTNQNSITFRFYVYGSEAAGGTGGLQGNLTFNGTLVAASTPTISTSVTNLPTFGTVNVGNNSASQNFTVSGSALTNDVLVSASTDYLVSLNNSTFSNSVNLTQSSGSLTGQPVTVYVRYSPTSPGVNNGTITLTSTGAGTKTVTTTGTGFAPGTPTINTSVSLLTTFGNVNVGNNSLSKNFTVTATDLTSDVTVSATTDYQVSIDNISFSTSTTLTQSAGSLVGEPVIVFVRYVPTSGGLNNGTLSLSSSGAVTKTVSVTGTGVIPPPVITTSAGSLPTFGTVTVGNNSTSQSFTASGTNLTASVNVVASADYQVSSDNISFSSTLTLLQSSGSLTGQPVTIYVRFVPTFNGASTGTITLSSTGATNRVVTVSGTGFIQTPTINTSVTSLTTFGDVNINASSTSQNFTVSGVDLTNDVTVGSSTDFVISLNNTTFSTSLTLAQAAGSLTGQPITVYVRFSPITAGLNNGTITLTSTGAVTKTVSVTGNGVVPIIDAPFANGADLITSNSFVASWDEVPGATSYRLDVSTSPTFGTQTPTTDLIISEYNEGSGFNKYIEVYNGTGSAVNLADYQLRLFSNGLTTPTTTSLTGTLANNATIVYRNSAATIYSGTTVVASAVNYNGDDAIALYKNSTSSYVDIFGSIGFDPGTEWTTGANTTVNKTLVRNSNVSSGITVNPASTFPTLGTQWTQFNQDDVTNLGSHTYAASTPSFLTGYQNLTVNSFTQAVTGLNQNTTYYYRVRAFDGTTSINSNVVEVTTLFTEPTFTSISQNASVCQDTNAQFTVTGLLPNTISKIGYTINNGTTQYFNNVSSNNTGNATVSLTLSVANNGQTLTVVSIERVDVTTTITTVTSGNTTTLMVQTASTYYADADGDGFGNPSSSILSCLVLPTGYVTNSADANDNLLTYVDADNDGFGSTVFAPNGPSNNSDCNDNQIQYQDLDADGFGNAGILVACGVTNGADANDNLLTYVDADNDGFGSTVFAPNGPSNNIDCNDNQIQYQDLDADGFGNAAILVACGVTNGADANDNLLTYVDVDNDGFGSTVLAPNGPSNNLDCNDNQIQYQDLDADGFGNASILVACGVTNGADANDNLLTYVDADNDGFGSSVLAPNGPSNNVDCNDNQIQYQDLDADGFGNAGILVACGVTNGADANDNLLTYVDADNDGFGSSVFAPNGPSNNLDCNDNQIQYQDLDADGFGNAGILVACGVTNGADANDNLLTYVDADNDGFGSSVFAPNGPSNNVDCNDNQIQYQDLDADGFGNAAILVACGVTNGADANDNLLTYVDADNDGFGSSVFAPNGPSNNNDCNDNNATITTGITFYRDFDNDGYGNIAITTSACTPPVGYVANSTDCNDNNAAINPAAIDVCYDGLDNNCDGIIDNGCVPIITVVQSTQCGSTLATIDQDIFANVVAGAQGYRFRVTDMSTMQVQTIDKALRVFKLTQLSNYRFNATYQVEVSVRRFNVWQPFYGAPCSVTTPATTTQLQASQCGGTITAMGDVIYANLVPFATGYRFRVINLLTSNVQVLDRPLREFRMNLLVSPQYNTQYSVEVAVRNTDGTYLPYGTICTITTPIFPTTSLQSSQCDYTATSASETIFATSFSGATTYRFRFVNTGLGYTYTFDRPIRSFVLNTVPGLLPATTYSVQISVELNGEFGPYGKVCSLTTPGSVARAIEKGATASAFKATASPNPYDNAFNINVATSSDSIIEVRVYDMIGKLIETQKVEATAIGTLQIGERYPSGVYNVIVSQGDQSQNVRVIKR